MAAGLKDMRDRIGSVKNTQKITDAMKLVAAVRERRASGVAGWRARRAPGGATGPLPLPSGAEELRRQRHCRAARAGQPWRCCKGATPQRPHRAAQRPGAVRPTAPPAPRPPPRRPRCAARRRLW